MSDPCPFCKAAEALAVPSPRPVFSPSEVERFAAPEHVVNIAGIAMKIVRADNAKVEQACEAALQGGEHGVLVVRSDGTLRVLSAAHDPDVPYGVIHEQRVP